MIIDCISDLHGNYPELEGGDLLIVAGDLTQSDKESQYWVFHQWIEKQCYSKKIVIAGNHDGLVEKDKDIMQPFGKMFDFLCDSGTEFEGLKIWGSPWTKTFPRMNPNCKAFTVDTEEELAEKWKLIPADTDILITHSPPEGYLDHTETGKSCGSESLFDWWYKKSKKGPKLWIFGHIHESYGRYDVNHYYSSGEMVLVNASHVNERYEPVNKPIRVLL